MNPVAYHPELRFQKSLVPTLWGLLINSFLSVAKLLAGWFGNSHALIADGVESLSDVISSIIVYRGIKIAAKPADQEHPYGHGKAEPISSAMVAGILLFAAGWIVLHSIQEIFKPSPPPAAYTLFILLGVIILKEALFRYTRKIGNQIGSMALSTDAWHHRSDAITSFAAVIGISVSLLGGSTFVWADKTAAILGALIITVNALILLRPALDDLMDKSPNPELLEQVRRIAGETPKVAQIEKCFIRKNGYYYLVDIHVEVDPQMTIKEGHHVAHHVKNRLMEHIPSIQDVLVHIEPRNDHPDSATLSSL